MDRRTIELEEGWNIMEQGIDKLKNLLEGVPGTAQFDSEEYMNLYTTIYNMCTQKPPNDFSQELYDRYRSVLEDYLRDNVITSPPLEGVLPQGQESPVKGELKRIHDVRAQVMPKLREERGDQMLKNLVRRWENHKVMVRLLSRFFNYLDRYFIPRNSLMSLYDVGMTCFRDQVYHELKERARDGILDLIQKDRNGEQIDRTLIKSVLGIFVEMGLGSMQYYENDFEMYLLKATSQYFSRKGAEWIEEDSTPEYLIKAEECIKQERERVERYLDSSSESKLLKEVDNQLLANYRQTLIEKEHSGCAALLRDEKAEDLARMYRLFQRINALEPIAKFFKEHIMKCGMELVREAEDAAVNKKEGKKDSSSQPEQVFVKNVIELHDKYMEYVTQRFANESIFHTALKNAFEQFCNKGVAGSTTPELLANFCDSLLKKGGSEKLGDEQIEETLGKVVKLLAYVTEKDLFAEFYRKKLSRRLLFDRSANDDHERSVLQKLKQECGAHFTSKMDGMVNDLSLARDTQNAFEEWLSQQPSEKQPKVDMNVTVLTTGFWPSYKTVDLNLPDELTKSMEAFNEFYEQKAQNRKLTWIYSLGQCHVQGRFDEKTMELIMSTFQAACLVLFNDNDGLSFEELQRNLNMPQDDLSRTLHSLACAKYKILTKEPDNKQVSSGDVFQLNTKFKDKLRRIRVPLPAVEDKKKVEEEVDKDRRYAIDAAIVRTMKSRKVMQHQQLTLEVVQQLQKSFKPDAKLIKKRIEELQQREYLERDPNDPNTYRYLA